MRKSIFKGLVLSNERVEGTTIEADFEALFAAHILHIFNFCNLQLNDAALAEDVTADVFERAWAHRHTYDREQADVTTWLFQIARNRVIDVQRKQGRQPTIALHEGVVDPSQSSPEEQVQSLELEQELIQFMVHLTVDEKMIVALKFGAGLGNKEIAEITEKSDEAVASSLYRAMGKLRKQWRKGEKSDE